MQLTNIYKEKVGASNGNCRYKRRVSFQNDKHQNIRTFGRQRRYCILPILLHADEF